MPRKPTIPRVCEQCGKEFLALSGNVKKGQGKVCSAACRHASHARHAVEQRRARFMAKITPQAEGCWKWPGPFGSHGYGQFQRELAHRVAYELFVGPIPAGLQIDHLCHNRWCVNPAHLEPVTTQENTRRAHEHQRARGIPVGRPRRGTATAAEVAGLTVPGPRLLGGGA